MDIKKLKQAGISTIKGIQMSMKKKLIQIKVSRVNVADPY